MAQITLYPTIIQTLVNNLQAWFQNVKFNKLNTITGATPQILATTTGTVVFTDTINATTQALLVLNNTLITATSVVQWGIIYSGGTGRPSQSYCIPTSNSIIFVVYNSAAQNTNANISIWYIIIA